MPGNEHQSARIIKPNSLPKSKLPRLALPSLPNNNLLKNYYQAIGLSESDLGQFLNPSLSALTEKMLAAKNLTKARDLILAECKSNSPIAIFSDSDLDGVTAAAQMTLCFNACNKKSVSLFRGTGTNQRFYHQEFIDELDKAQIKLLLVFDISNLDPRVTAYAANKGIKVVSLDHHELTNSRASDLCLVNPMQPDCGLYNTGICSAGLATALVLALKEGLCLPDEIINECLARSTLGLVSDCASFKTFSPAWYIYRLSLSTLNGNLQWFNQVSYHVNACPNHVSLSTLVYKIVPFFNGALRQGEINDLYTALTSYNAETQSRAILTVHNAYKANKEQSQITLKNFRNVIISNGLDREELILLRFDFHTADYKRMGAVANSLSRDFKKPVMIIQDCHDKEGNITGTIRDANNQYNLYSPLRATSQYLRHYGGHRFAAGFKISKNDYRAFKEAYLKALPLYRSNLSQTIIQQSFSDLDFSSHFELEKLAGFDASNPRPIIQTSAAIADSGSNFEIFDFKQSPKNRKKLTAYPTRGALLAITKARNKNATIRGSLSYSALHPNIQAHKSKQIYFNDLEVV